MGRPFNCNCKCKPIVSEYYRMVECIGPVVGDTSVPGYTSSWGFAPVNQYGIPVTGSVWCSLQSQTSNALPVRRYMQPMRFRYTQVQNPFYIGISQAIKYESSYSTPPATSSSHFSGSYLFQQEQGSAGAPRTFFGTEGNLLHGTSPELNGKVSRVTHTRLLLDGVDMTGPVAVNATLSNRSGSNGNFVYAAPTGTATMATVARVSNAETVEIDAWVDWNPAAWTRGPTDPTSGTARGTALAAFGVEKQSQGNIRVPFAKCGSIDLSRVPITGRWKATFSGRTVGGATELVFENQPGWSYTRTGFLIGMGKTSGTEAGDGVRIRFDSETPVLEVIDYDVRQLESGGGGVVQPGIMRYHAESPSYYGPLGPANRQWSPLDLTGANTMVRNARGIYLLGNAPGWQAVETVHPSLKDPFPTSVVLELL